MRRFDHLRRLLTFTKLKKWVKEKLNLSFKRSFAKLLLLIQNPSYLPF